MASCSFCATSGDVEARAASVTDIFLGPVRPVKGESMRLSSPSSTRTYSGGPGDTKGGGCRQTDAWDARGYMRKENSAHWCEVTRGMETWVSQAEQVDGTRQSEGKEEGEESDDKWCSA